jgi:uncharacterized RDD family membrane protein YckC
MFRRDTIMFREPLCQSRREEIESLMDTAQVLYATLPRRIKAAIIDGVVLLTLMILSPLTISMLVGRDSGANAIVMYIPPLLLEPFLITFLGFTLGQYILGIQVIRAESGGKCPLPVSFLRYFAKAILGSLSMIYMLFSKKHQAIHDHFAKTLVVLSPKRVAQNPEFANLGETEQNLEADITYNYPSAFKRFILFCVWAAITLIVLGIVAESTALILVPSYTVETEKMPMQIEVIFNLIYAVLFIWLAVLASKGLLPGARKKSKVLENNFRE